MKRKEPLAQGKRLLKASQKKAFELGLEVKRGFFRWEMGKGT